AEGSTTADTIPPPPQAFDLMQQEASALRSRDETDDARAARVAELEAEVARMLDGPSLPRLWSDGPPSGAPAAGSMGPFGSRPEEENDDAATIVNRTRLLPVDSGVHERSSRSTMPAPRFDSVAPMAIPIAPACRSEDASANIVAALSEAARAINVRL